MNPNKNKIAESQRLTEANSGQTNWRCWGPYLSERQWGTVREDYSPHGNAWEYLPHDHARSRAYRWGEDGIAGVSDDQQRLCLSLALWNGHDPILKERLFGLTNSEGNHGEDVKELYYYLDATPTNSYLKMLYKYPQKAFPYGQLVEENRRRGKDQQEFELLDTGIFDDDRYFDVFIEYAKAGPEDLLMLVTVHNRGPEQATIHVLPQLWFRNTWSWTPGSKKPELRAENNSCVIAEHLELGSYRLYTESTAAINTGLQPGGAMPNGQRNRLNGLLNSSETSAGLNPGVNESLAIGPDVHFCDNETNVRRLYGQDAAQGFFKDAFHEFVIEGNKGAVNPNRTGTKAGALYHLTVRSGGSATVRLRLVKEPIVRAARGASKESGNG
ncbi:MAG TPA: hypothetical protein VL361_21535, partial [Candidatus Limnocylindrales bacterium]|nr:hypothetical protein [Candidatus Limnocylindrales bacterium]